MRLKVRPICFDSKCIGINENRQLQLASIEPNEVMMGNEQFVGTSDANSDADTELRCAAHSVHTMNGSSIHSFIQEKDFRPESAHHLNSLVEHSFQSNPL